MERLGKPRHRRERPEADANGSERIKSLAVSEKFRDVSTSLDMTNQNKAYARAGVDVDVSNRPTLARGDFNRARLIEPYRLGCFSNDIVEPPVVAQLIPNGIEL
jgi:hypothetical protein